MNFRMMFPGKYIENTDLGFGVDRMLTIKRIYPEQMEMEDGSLEQKWLMQFNEAKKSLVISRTVAEACTLMFGDETDKWIGKRLVLFGINTEKAFAVRINVRGSPDIKVPMKKNVKRGQKTIRLDLVPTKTGAAAKPDAKTQRLDGQSDAPFQAEPPPLGDQTKPTADEIAASNAAEPGSQG